MVRFEIFRASGANDVRPRSAGVVKRRPYIGGERCADAGGERSPDAEGVRSTDMGGERLGARRSGA